MQRILAGVILLLLGIGLVACGGDDGGSDDADSGGGGSGATTAATATAADDAEADVVLTEEAAASSEDDTSGGMPNVTVPLAVGSSGEVQSHDADPSAISASGDFELGPLKVTVNQILDPATTDSEIFQPEPGNRYWAFEVTMEATGDTTVNTGVWTLRTTDGAEYTNVMLTGVGEDIFYESIDAGQSVTGVVVFQIPEDAQVESVTLDPNIYVGSDLIFEGS